MNESNMARINATFKQLHQDGIVVYKDVYDSIYQQLKGSTSYGLSGEIAQLEAKKLNQELLSLTDAVKKAAISEMIFCGCKQYLTQAGWTEIQQAAGLPHTELCKIQVDTTTPPAEKANPVGTENRTIHKNKQMEELAHQYGTAEKIFACVTGLGAAAVIISLFIPGWPFPIKVLCVSGAAVAVLSGSGAIYFNSKKNEAASKFEYVGNSAPLAEQGTMDLDFLVKRITDSQCERNLKLYDKWLEDVKYALISECDKLSAM